MSGPLSPDAWERVAAAVPQLLSSSRNRIMVESLLLGMRSANFPFNDNPEGEYQKGSLQLIARQWNDEGLLTQIVQALDEEGLIANWPLSVEPEIMLQRNRRLRDILVLALMRTRGLPVPPEPSQEEIDKATSVSELLGSVEGFSDNLANRMFLEHLDALMTDPDFHWAHSENGETSYSILKRLERDDTLYTLLKRIVELGLAEHWPEAAVQRNPFQRKTARDRIYLVLKKAKSAVLAKRKRTATRAASEAKPPSSRKPAVQKNRQNGSNKPASDKVKSNPRRGEHFETGDIVQKDVFDTDTSIEAMMNRPGRVRPGIPEAKAGSNRNKFGISRIKKR